MRTIRYILFMMLIFFLAVSCQKDEDIKGNETALNKADSAKILNAATTQPSNILAVTGTLKITIKDSTYTFDAATDSIAIVNVYLENQKYFGITAINKAHTISFGVSSLGYAAANITKDIAGSQLLFNINNKSNVQYTLSQSTAIPGPGKINLAQYSQDSVLAKGTFTTYLAKDVKLNSPFYKVEGSFSLKMK